MTGEREWLVWLDIPHAGTAKIVTAEDGKAAITAAVDLYLNRESREWDEDWPSDRAQFLREELRSAVSAPLDDEAVWTSGGDQTAVTALREAGPW